MAHTRMMLVLAVLVPGVWSQTFNQKQFKIDGATILMDVGSMFYRKDTTSYTVNNPTECQQYCQTLPGCNAYAFCDKKEGCGSECSYYLSSLPKVLANATNPTSPNSAWRLPIINLGPFGPTNTCQGRAWPYKICTLRTISNFDMPQDALPTPDEGWVSGWLSAPLPAACSGLSARACARCQSLAALGAYAVTACLSCAKSAGVQPLESLFNGIANDTRAETCAACYSTADNPAQCAACLSTATTDITAESCISSANTRTGITINDVTFQDIASTTTTTTTTSTPSPSPGAIAGGVLGGLAALLAIAAALVLLYRRGKHAALQATSPPTCSTNLKHPNITDHLKITVDVTPEPQQHSPTAPTAERPALPLQAAQQAAAQPSSLPITAWPILPPNHATPHPLPSAQPTTLLRHHLLPTPPTTAGPHTLAQCWQGGAPHEGVFWRLRQLPAGGEVYSFCCLRIGCQHAGTERFWSVAGGGGGLVHYQVLGGGGGGGAVGEDAVPAGVVRDVLAGQVLPLPLPVPPGAGAGECPAAGAGGARC